MRTLSEITAAVRQAEPVTEEELRYAVVAYDVMVAQMELPNDPAFAGARERYKAMHGAGNAFRSLKNVSACGVCEGVGLYDAGLGVTRECNACKGTGLIRSS